MNETGEDRMTKESIDQQVLLIGLDGADFSIIDAMIQNDKLPALSELISDGVHANLVSSVPPWTPTAWTSLTSGKNPGKHGIFDFKTVDGERLVNGTDVHTNRIWEYLTIADRSSIIVNVPVTHPSPEIDGVLIPGYLGPEADQTHAHPEGIVEELRDAIGEYRIYARDGLESDEERCDEFIKLIRMRRDAITYLCDSYDWDFAMVQFQRTDTVFHELPEEHYIERVFSYVDQCIDDILRSVSHTTVIIASDHGMGSTGAWDFRLNTWLDQQGYLKSGLDGRTIGWEKPTKTGIDNKSVFQSLISALAHIGLTPRKAQSALKRVGLSEVALRILPSGIINKSLQAGGEKLDTESSIAFCPSGPSLGIYCEEHVVDDIIGALEGLRDPDGRLVAELVAPASEVWDGPMADVGPDILFLPRDMEYFVSATLTASVFDETSYKYNHMKDGILIAVGAEIEARDGRGRFSIHDIAPTVLALLGVSLDSEFDGDVIERIHHRELPAVRQYEKTKRQLKTSEDESVQSRLEDLGYL